MPRETGTLNKNLDCDCWLWTVIAECVPNPTSIQPKEIKDKKGTMAQRNQVNWLVADKKTGIRELIWIPQQVLINKADLLITKEN